MYVGSDIIANNNANTLPNNATNRVSDNRLTDTFTNS